MTNVAVSGMRHVTHAIYVASWCRWMLETKGASLRVFDYDAERHSADVHLGIRTALDSVPVDWAVDSGPTRADYYVSVGSPGVKPWLRLGRPAATVSVDEGLSSYGDSRSRFRAMRREGASLPAAVVRALGGEISRRRIGDEEWRTYHRSGSRWAVNPVVADEFGRRVTGAAGDPGEAIYLAQPWVRLGLVPAADYRAHLERTRASCDRAGLRLVVRPHHSDDALLYEGFDCAPAEAPAEITRSVVEAGAVIGEHSSALVNLAAFGIASVQRVMSPAESVLERALSSDQRSLLDQYLPAAVAPEDLALA